MMKTNLRGFTLLELMIVVTVIGVLTALAMPAYQKYVQRAKRSDAANALMSIAAAEEKYYFQNNKYGDNDALGLSDTSPEKYYSIAVAVGEDDNGQSYTITATATGAQASDTDCATFTLDNTGKRGPSPDDNGCWHR